MSKDVKDFSNLLFHEDQQAQFNQIADGMEIDPTALLRRLHEINITDQKMTLDETKVIITVFGTMGIRNDTGTAAEMLTGLHGFDWANAVKRCETVAKRRLTTNLLGYGYKHSLEEVGNFAATTVNEPHALETPGPVNSAAASVVPDTRIDLVDVTNLPAPVTPLSTVVAPSEVVKVPFVTEAGLATMHKESAKLDKQHTPQTEAYIPQPDAPAFVKATPMSSQVGFFDEPTPPGATQIEVIPAQPPAMGTPAVPAVGATPVPVSGTTVPGLSTEPTPIQDIKVEPVVSTAPNQQQYRAIQVRCTKLVRDVLPKAGKGADALFLPHVRKTLGTNELQKGSLLVWEELLGQLEAFTTAKDLATFLNGGKLFNGK